jgi:hypothetical protein
MSNPSNPDLISKVVQLLEAFLKELPPSGAHRMALTGAQTRV